jgi:hypothetical protein
MAHSTVSSSLQRRSRAALRAVPASKIEAEQFTRPSSVRLRTRTAIWFTRRRSGMSVCDNGARHSHGGLVFCEQLIVWCDKWHLDPGQPILHSWTDLLQVDTLGPSCLPVNRDSAVVSGCRWWNRRSLAVPISKRADKPAQANGKLRMRLGQTRILRLERTVRPSRLFLVGQPVQQVH